MFTLCVVRNDSEGIVDYAFTIVKPDATYLSGRRNYIAEINEVFLAEMVKWETYQKRNM
jgi:hypothetical protein